MQNLDDAKLVAHERSLREAVMKDLGILSGGRNQAVWSQAETAISLKRRLENGDLTEAEVEGSLARLASSFVATTPGAAKRCVDGSSSEGYDDGDAASYGRPLGPQIQGGTADEAIVMHMLQGFEHDAVATILTDMDKIACEQQSDFRPGDHTDNHANDQKTGCGAIDGQPRKLLKYNDVAAEVIKSVADAVAGLANLHPGAEVFARMQIAAKKLADRPEYFADAPSVVAKLRALNPDGLEKLIRPHGEISLTLNFVPNTTFHRDHYNAGTNSKIQNFNLDVWNILKDNDEAEAYALLLDAAATLVDLTDGSLRLFARTE